MQVPSATIGQVGRCKSASAADLRLHSCWRFKNHRHEGVPVTSCVENSASEWSQKLAARLSLANDVDELLCKWHQHDVETRTISPASCCLASRPKSSHVIVSSFHTQCHCVACCSCSPCDQQGNNRPVFTFPAHTWSVPVQRALSLDSGLALCRSCSERFSAVKDADCASPADLVQNSVKPDALMHKSSSVPACCSSHMKYYNAGISFDSLNDDSCCQSQNVNVDFTATDSTPVCNDATSASVVTQSVDEIQLLPTAVSSTVYMNDEVSPLEYRKRFEVCLFETNIFKVHMLYI